MRGLAERLLCSDCRRWRLVSVRQQCAQSGSSRSTTKAGNAAIAAAAARWRTHISGSKAAADSGERCDPYGGFSRCCAHRISAIRRQRLKQILRCQLIEFDVRQPLGDFRSVHSTGASMWGRRRGAQLGRGDAMFSCAPKAVSCLAERSWARSRRQLQSGALEGGCPRYGPLRKPWRAT